MGDIHLLVMPSWYPTPTDPLAGIFFREQAIATRKAGLPVRVAVPQRFLSNFLYRRARKILPLAEQTQEDGVPVYRWSIGVGWGGRFPAWMQYRLFLWGGEYCFRRYIAEQGMPDLIHVHSILWAGVLAAYLKRRYRVPFVVTEHSSAYHERLVSRFERQLTTDVLRMADVRTFVSPRLGEEMDAQFGTAASPWVWTPNLVERRFRLGSGKREPAPGAPFVFLSVGSLVWYKEYPTLLRAFAQRFAGDIDTRLRVVGHGPLGAELKILASDLGISAQVDFLGMLDREQVLAQMHDADALVHASPFETFGVVLVEALACGLPVVAASEGGPRAIINDSNGILTPPGDPSALGQAMVELRSRIADYDASAISDDCIRRFGETAVVERLLRLYAGVLDRTSAALSGASR